MNNEPVFAGLKVVDVASYIAGPAAATVLGDLGADVIKVEPPGLGDLQRYLGRTPPNPRAEANYAWHMTNRNKRGMAVDLKSQRRTEVLKRLVEWADVLITNYPHGTREKLHLGYDEVAAGTRTSSTPTSPASVTTARTHRSWLRHHRLLGAQRNSRVDARRRARRRCRSRAAATTRRRCACTRQS